ncbi:MAG: oligosaccharide flippase family protein [Gammaproteobacteria bacterium]|nr:oligosaccharide flippase family protein [Gammaproteobacteria bacterium]MCK5091904.1 oligosaccharide flippase family protein [Gammaproteobacteria bacterium]
MLARKLAFSFSSRMGVMVLGMITSIIVARIAGPVVLGTFSSAAAVVSLFGLMGTLGLNSTHLRILPGSQNPESAIAVFIILKAIFISVMMIALGLYIYSLSSNSNESNEYIIILIICSITIVMDQVSKIGIFTFNARVERRKAELPSVANTIIASLVKVAVVAAGYGAIALAYSELAGAVVLILVTVYMWRGTSIGRPSMEITKEYMVCAFPLLFVSISQGVVQNLDKVMIKYAYPGVLGFTEVGIYTAGARLGAIILTLAAVVSVIFFPTFARLAKNNEIEKIKQVLERYENLLVYFLMPLCILLVVFSEPIILLLLGEKYRASAAILQITTIGFFIFSFNQPYLNFFGAVTKKLILIVSVYLIYTLSNIVFNIVLIPESFSGMEMAGLKSSGAAIATTISYVLLGVMVRVLGRIRLGVASTFSKYKKEFAILFLLTLAVSYMYHIVGEVTILHVMVASIIYMLSYIALGLLLCRVNSRMALESIGKIHPGINSMIGRIVK